jgi:hypothetical protein
VRGACRGIACVEGFFDPLVSLTYPVPKIALLPILMSWLGLGDASRSRSLRWRVLPDLHQYLLWRQDGESPAPMGR